MKSKTETNVELKSKWELCSEILPFGSVGNEVAESKELPLYAPSLTRNCPPRDPNGTIYLEKYEQGEQGEEERTVLIVTRVIFGKDFMDEDTIDKVYAKETISYGGLYEIIEDSEEKEFDYETEIEKYHALKWINFLQLHQME